MISLSNLEPLRNSNNIPVDQDIKIGIIADFKLDPRDISFKINGVEVKPNVFSTYNGPLDSSLDITLYSRQRIKYGDGYRYGDDGLRYGMRDSLPSILNYNSRYVIEYTVWGINDLGEREEFTDSFSFITEEGVFYNDNYSSYFYSDKTQAISNYFPEWSKTRYDKYSNFQQLLNPIGEELEKISDLVTFDGLNNYIQTSNLNQLSKIYKVRLDSNMDFTSTIGQDGEQYFIPPIISGIQGITRFDLFTEESNSLSEFYYKKIPTRIDTERSSISENIFFGPEKSSSLPFILNKTLEKEGSFVLKVSGVKSFIEVSLRNQSKVFYCQIKGVGLFDNDQVEDLYLLNDIDTFTTKEWTKINSIQFFNSESQDFIFQLSYFPEELSLLSDYKLITTPSDERELILWKGEKRGERTVLQKLVTEGKNTAEMLRNGGATHVIQEFEILDIDNETSLDLLDITVDPYSDYLYGICNQCLYIFNKKEDYPTILKKIPGDNGAQDVIIELDSDELGLEEDGTKEVLFKVINKNLGRDLLRYRIKLIKPDGSFLYIKEAGQTTINPAESIIRYTSSNYIIDEKQFSIKLDQIGDYLLELESIYSKGNTSKHFQLVRILKKSAVVKYNLKRILNEDIPKRIVYDKDQRIKLITENSIVHTLTLRKDGVLIDYSDKILYFLEEYNSVDVE